MKCKYLVKEKVYSSESDDEQDDARHYNLLRSIKKLTGKNRIKCLRNEVVTSVNRIKSTDKVSLKDLIDVGVSKEISKTKKALSKQAVLKVPANKGEQEKLRRIIGYEEAKKILTKWDPIVKENRKIKHLIFPLEQGDINIFNSTPKLNKCHEPQSEMEKEVADILRSNQDLNFEKKFLSKAEQRALDAMSLAEAAERRSRLQKHRALMSYYGAKMKRDGKIKSKRHHRMMRKVKKKAAAKNLENLKNVDPAAYKIWLDREEKNRAEERMTLKHKGGSRHMKKQTIYGKYNLESRQAVQDMLQLGKEMTAKNSNFQSDQSDNDDINNADYSSIKNPWSNNGVVSGSKDNEDNGDNETLSKIRDSTQTLIGDDDKRKNFNKREIYDLNNDDNDPEDSKRSENNVETNGRYSAYRATNDAIVTSRDESSSSSDDDYVDDESTDAIGSKDKSKGGSEEGERKEDGDELIDVKNALTVGGKARDKNGVSRGTGGSENFMQMAFEDDNILEDFVREKHNVEDRDKPKDIYLAIPGWGEWTGPGIAMSKKKKVPTATLR